MNIDLAAEPPSSFEKPLRLNSPISCFAFSAASSPATAVLLAKAVLLCAADAKIGNAGIATAAADSFVNTKVTRCPLRPAMEMGRSVGMLELFDACHTPVPEPA